MLPFLALIDSLSYQAFYDTHLRDVCLDIFSRLLVKCFCISFVAKVNYFVLLENS